MARLKIRKILSICGAGIMILYISISCSNLGCLENRSAIPLADFYSSSEGKAISLTGVKICGLDSPGDSAVLITPPAATQVYLPMRSTQSLTTWVIYYRQEGLESPEYNDTVEFRYDSEAFFASAECGAMYRYRIRNVRNTVHLLDSVGILDSLITNLDVPRIRFYFRTAAMEEGEK